MSPTLVIRPFQTPARGVAQVPGSKSITNRALILAALADGVTLFTGALFSRDTRILIAALQSLGFEVSADESACTIRITGLGGRIPNARAKIHVGNAGTAARFLTAFLALAPEGRYELDGDEAMRARPMRGLLDALTAGGCRALQPDGSPACGFPFTLHTTGKLGRLEVDASASSQLLSALLMVIPLSAGASVSMKGSTVSEPFVEMTARMCGQFGRPLERLADGCWTCASPGAYVAQTTYAIEPDATAASYFIALPAVTGSRASVRIEGYADGGLQGDTAFAKVAAACGATLKPANGTLVTESWSGILGGDFDFNAFSDTFLTLATIATLAAGPVKIRGIAHTRKQETDRVLAMATELERLGIKVAPSAAELRADETLSSLTIFPGKAALRQAAADGPIAIRTYEDHRMAMSFGILGSFDLFGDGRPWIAIEDPACTGKTFPHFFQALEALRTNFVRVSVDGGAASGKSSTSRRLAQLHGLLHVDTGAHYRSLTRALLLAGATADDPASVKAGLGKLRIGSRVIARQGARSSALTLDGVLPDDADLRTPEVNAAVSKIAALPSVRTYLLEYQRAQVKLASDQGFAGVVMEGRDIGSVVLPDAEVRIFLEADPDARAQRRAAEGQSDQVTQRDRLDATRKTAPLICPQGAHRLDNTHKTLQEVVSEISDLIKIAALPR
ncbi:MAG: 3-phosphoshikimate 1-carboxyvinyltransferase [Verrucomicrobia bacterium]|nr:3-phosphoshikimate 1-carboxyvinyltransferase [Verrucomicrobiota bacterium]